MNRVAGALLLLSLSPFPRKAGTGFLMYAQLTIPVHRFLPSFRRVNGT
jgi:hypothetical protein